MQISAGVDAHSRGILSTRVLGIVDARWSSGENSLAIIGYERHRGIDKYKILIFGVDCQYN